MITLHSVLRTLALLAALAPSAALALTFSNIQPDYAGANQISGNPSNWAFKDLAAFIISYVNLIVPILGGIAIIVFFWGLIKYIAAAGDSSAKTNGRSVMYWGTVALFILFSVWGIVAVLKSTFLGQGGGGTSFDNTSCFITGHCLY